MAGSEIVSVLQHAHRKKVYWFNPLTMYSRDLIERENLRFDPAVLMGQDSVFNAKAFHKAKAIYAMPDRLYLIRQRPSSQTSHGNPDWNRRIGIQYRALKTFYETESLWPVTSQDYYRYVLEFQLPQAILNSCKIAADRKGLVKLLGDLRNQDWVANALQRSDIWHGLSLKRLIVGKLVKYRLFTVIAQIYPPQGIISKSIDSD